MQGALLLEHGTQKLFGLPGATTPVRPLLNLFGISGLIECTGGLLLLLGLWTRPAAFLCSGLMASAYFMAHVKRGFWPIVNQGELAVIYCFVCLYLWAAGPGPWSLDALSRGRR